MVCILIYEIDPVGFYQGYVRKVCYSEYELQGDRKPAGAPPTRWKQADQLW